VNQQKEIEALAKQKESEAKQKEMELNCTNKPTDKPTDTTKIMVTWP